MDLCQELWSQAQSEFQFAAPSALVFGGFVVLAFVLQTLRLLAHSGSRGPKPSAPQHPRKVPTPSALSCSAPQKSEDEEGRRIDDAWFFEQIQGHGEFHSPFKSDVLDPGPQPLGAIPLTYFSIQGSLGHEVNGSCSGSLQGTNPDSDDSQPPRDAKSGDEQVKPSAPQPLGATGAPPNSQAWAVPLTGEDLGDPQGKQDSLDLTILGLSVTLILLSILKVHGFFSSISSPYIPGVV